MSLFLVPATRDNLEKSIENSVPISFVKKYLPEIFINEIVKFSGIEGIRCWAMTENRLSIYNEMQQGDEVLLTEKRTGYFTHYGVIIGKIENLAFGKALWPIVGENPWKYIYFLANITKVQIDKSNFVQQLGYASNFTVPGVIKVAENEYKKIGTISKWFEIPVFENVTEVNENQDFSGSNIQSAGTRRIGHNAFSKEIKKNYEYKCSICSISEPEFLIAGHISPWSEDVTNRLNPQNGICLCPIHDKAFEHGYIGIDNNFKVIINSKINKTSILYLQLNQFCGCEINKPIANLPNKEFLKKHRMKHKLGEYDN